jgi:hypothetical protein
MRVGFDGFIEGLLFATVIETSNVLARLLLTFLVFAVPRLPVFFIGRYRRRCGAVVVDRN